MAMKAYDFLVSRAVLATISQRTKLRVVSKSCTGYDKSKDKTESSK